VRGRQLNRQSKVVGLFRVDPHEGIRALDRNYTNGTGKPKSETFEENNIPISNEGKYFFFFICVLLSVTRGEQSQEFLSEISRQDRSPALRAALSRVLVVMGHW
jgi:hypothetical protein